MTFTMGSLVLSEFGFNLLFLLYPITNCRQAFRMPYCICKMFGGCRSECYQVWRIWLKEAKPPALCLPSSLPQLYSFSRESKKQFQNIFIRTSSTLLSQLQNVNWFELFCRQYLPSSLFSLGRFLWLNWSLPSFMYMWGILKRMRLKSQSHFYYLEFCMPLHTFLVDRP